MKKIKANLIGEKITSNTAEAQNLFATSRFGEKFENKILYSMPEALLLLEDKKIEIFNHQDKKLTEKEVLKKFQKIDKKFLCKYIVFKDLRKKGYIVKTALKFGADFRVYEKGKKTNQTHSKWICFTASENENLKWQDFSSKNRIAHSVKKNLLIAITDEEADVSYYEIKWTRT
jgi:tRNA-intron endonuclease